MVILGCQVKPWGQSILLQDRLDKALDYLEEHPDVQVVVSGGQGPDEPTTEAQAMYDYLTEHGVEPERIWQEDQSHNTWQNVRYTCLLYTSWITCSPSQGRRKRAAGCPPGGQQGPVFPSARLYPNSFCRFS